MKIGTEAVTAFFDVNEFYKPLSGEFRFSWSLESLPSKKAQPSLAPEPVLTLARKDLKNAGTDFPGGPVVKNPPANAGDTGSIPGQARLRMLWSN